MQYTSALAADYAHLWATCEIDYEPDAVRKQAARVLANKNLYSGFWSVPWWFIGLCDLRECNLDPQACLHNGERIIGMGRKTSLAPAGRGPFSTKAASIRDSLILQGLDTETDWSVGKTLFRLEGYNGFGYRAKGVPSPYLWSHTNHYADGSWDDDPKGGKYYADHKWSPDIYDKQIGACAVLKALVAMDSSVRFGGPEKAPPTKTESTATPAPAPAPAPVKKAAGPVVAGTATATAAHQAGLPLWAVVAAGLVVAAVLAFFILRNK